MRLEPFHTRMHCGNRPGLDTERAGTVDERRKRVARVVREHELPARAVHTLEQREDCLLGASEFLTVHQVHDADARAHRSVNLGGASRPELTRGQEAGARRGQVDTNGSA